MIINCLPTTAKYADVLIKIFLKKFSSSSCCKTVINDIKYDNIYINVNMIYVITSAVIKALSANFVDYKFTIVWSYET